MRKLSGKGDSESKSNIQTDKEIRLMEAEKMTSVYAKMEYGVKRLLWLGG